MRPVHPKTGLILAATAALVAGGCATPVGHAPSEVPRVMGPANQGAAWDVVFSGPATTAAGELAGAEYARRDYTLAEPPQSDLPDDAWPQPYRPDLSQTRRLFLNLSPNEVLYIQQYPSGYYWRGTAGGAQPWPWW